MSTDFLTLVRMFAGQLLLLTRRILQCSPVRLAAAVPVFLVNQVSFVLSMMLPLKVIIMLGSDGVPRYFRFFMTEETRDAWLVGLAAGAVGMFLLHLLGGVILTRLGRRGGERVLEHSRKTGLFDDQDRFASDVFLRVASTWGTLVMSVGAVALGLWLEWRLVVLVLAAVVIEFVGFVVYWNRVSAPEHAEDRERLQKGRGKILQSLSAINVLILFAGLVVLFLTDPSMNFLVGILMFLLARQILTRTASMFGDASFFLQNRERIDALVHPGRHLREKYSSDRASFEHLLMPDRRGRFFRTVGDMAGVQLAERAWQWRDAPGKATALFVSEPVGAEDPEYRLKVKMRAGDAGLMRETMFHRSQSASSLALSCELVDTGSLFGRGYLLLRSGTLVPCPAERVREHACSIRMRLWKHRPDRELAARLLRSFPSLDARIDSERLARMRLACNDSEQSALLNHLLERQRALVDALQSLPRVLSNSALTAANIMLDADEQPVLLHWEAIRFEVIGADLVPADLAKQYSAEKLGEEMSQPDWPDQPLPEWALPLVVHASQLDRLTAQEAYAAALDVIPQLLEYLDVARGDEHETARVTA
ncbi:MAG: hypothetical protein RQ826_16835 [Xanthomonadales bacterium]|nr:hypothetical protein [Xanthomonadales bacterium]